MNYPGPEVGHPTLPSWQKESAHPPARGETSDIRHDPQQNHTGRMQGQIKIDSPLPSFIMSHCKAA
jgi:hypothetical protein